MFFKNEDGTYKGGALRVYHGDVEEYWTHITPEFCNLLDLYKAYWKSKFMAYPIPSDPLLVQERLPYPAGKNPDSVASTVIYIACVKTGINLSQQKISKVSGITKVTIRNRCNDYLKYIKLI